MVKKITLLLAITAIGVAGLEGCSNVPEKAQTQGATDGKPAIIAESTGDQESENGQTALYTDFTQARYTEYLGKKPFALFFYAGWCPDCVYLEEQIRKNIGNLPKEAIILKANYDTEIQLKREYGITVQSTIIVLNKDGKAQPTLFGPSFAELKSAIEQSL